MEFRVLGPLEVRENGRALELGGAKQRAVLAVLVLHANQVVSLDQLIETIWGEQPPQTAAAAVHGSVSQLRKVLEPNGAPYGVLQTRAPGYLVAVNPESIDRFRFDRLAAEGRAALADGGPDRASEVLRKALALWRGPALGDVAHAIADPTEVERLEEERLAVLEDRIKADLALGRHATLVPELEALVGHHPLREGLRAQLMIALYGSGRQADALAVYHDLRRTLDEQLGIAPGNEIRDLERRILLQDAELSARRPTPPPRQTGARVGRARLAVLLAAAAALAVAAALLSFARAGDDPRVERLVRNGLGSIDPDSNRLVQSIPVGSFPVDVAVDDDAIWVANAGDHTISRVDPEDGRVTTTKGLRGAPVRLRVGRDTLWIATSHFDQPASLLRLDRAPNQSAEHVVELTPEFGLLSPVLAGGASGLWASLLTKPDTFVVPPAGEVHRLDALPPGCIPVGSAIADGTVWIGCQEGRLVRIDERTRRRLGTTRVGSFLSAMAVGAAAVWLTDPLEDVVWRVDAATGQWTRAIPVGRNPFAVAAGFGSIWVADRESGTVSRIDPKAGRVVATIRTGRGVTAIAVGPDRVWVTAPDDEQPH